ncbi:MAG TPA: ATPase, T2SS/T4P/T4SS family [Blastocatellia bacterium]|nr:ATPase, T2SS/T4P/T4SS family [Blastocatellia bacterium]
MTGRISINTYRMGKVALQMREFTVTELMAASDASKETAQSFVFELGKQEKGFLTREDIARKGPGRPIRRYSLTRKGIEHLTHYLSPFAQEFNETAFVQNSLLRPRTNLPTSSSSNWKDNLEGWLTRILPSFDLAAEQGASAMLLEPGACGVRIGQRVEPMPGRQAYPLDEVSEAVKSILTPWQHQRLQMQGWTACAHRFQDRALNVHVRMAGGKPLIEIRKLPKRVSTIEDLHLSPTVSRFSTLKRGLILVTGIAGSGRNETIAAMIRHINASEKVHITTIEEPLYCFHERQQSFIEQRQVAIDTPDFNPALEEALAAGPGTVVLSDLNNQEMIATVLSAAESRLLVCRVTAPSAAVALRKVINLFPPDDQIAVRSRLASNLVGIITLTALREATGTRVALAAEVLPWSKEARDCLLGPPKASTITECLLRCNDSAESLKSSVRRLYKSKVISHQVAKRYLSRKG